MASRSAETTGTFVIKLGGDFNFCVLLRLLLLRFVARKQTDGTRSGALVFFALGIVLGPLPILVIEHNARSSVKFDENIVDRWYR
jgi:hypothetical protein